MTPPCLIIQLHSLLTSYPLGEDREFPLIDQVRIRDDLRIRRLPEDGVQACGRRDATVDQIAQHIAGTYGR